MEARAYIWLTDLLRIPRNDSREREGTLVIVFGIEVDKPDFTARLPRDKLEKDMIATVQILKESSVSFIDIQSLIEFISFCSQAVRLGRVFIRRLCDLINNFPRKAPRTMLRGIPAWVREDLERWNKLLPTYNGLLFFDTSSNRGTNVPSRGIKKSIYSK